MMTAKELKKILVQRIILTKEQRKDIIESKKQIEQGLFIEQDEMDIAFTKWLSEK